MTASREELALDNGGRQAGIQSSGVNIDRGASVTSAATTTTNSTGLERMNVGSSVIRDLSRPGREGLHERDYTRSDFEGAGSELAAAVDPARRTPTLELEGEAAGVPQEPRGGWMWCGREGHATELCFRKKE